jgi:hypothetical protein
LALSVAAGVSPAISSLAFRDARRNSRLSPIAAAQRHVSAQS